MLYQNLSYRAACYGADMHCIACAEAAHGGALYRREGATDSEGNPVTLVLEIEEAPPEGEYCGTCGREISKPWLPDGYEVFAMDAFEASEYAAYLRADDPTSDIEAIDLVGWYWQSTIVSPTEPSGPFETEDEAVRDCVEPLGW